MKFRVLKTELLTTKKLNKEYKIKKNTHQVIKT